MTDDRLVEIHISYLRVGPSLNDAACSYHKLQVK
jgi:hypothetical protein